MNAMQASIVQGTLRYLSPTRAARVIAYLAIALLASCASLVPVPVDADIPGLPLMLLVTQDTEAGAEENLLVVQADGPGTRWSLLDALGAPRARQILQNGKWRNDGFLPPNAQARALFSALVFAWTPTEHLAARYGIDNLRVAANTRTLSRNGRAIATVVGTPLSKLEIHLNGGARWTVTSLGAVR